MNVQTGTGQENMAADLAMVQQLQATGAQQLWRFYTWQPWAVSLGKHQSFDAIDCNAATRHGIDVVHRPTGGRAVLHADELTYCVVSKGDPAAVYESVHKQIYHALCLVLGMHSNALEFDTVGSDLRKHYASGSDMGQACFATSAKSEIMVRGRKVVGSAQRVIHDIVLQHGSILCGPSHLLLADLVNIPQSRREQFRIALANASISLSEIANRTILPQEIANSFATQEQTMSM